MASKPKTAPKTPRKAKATVPSPTIRKLGRKPVPENETRHERFMRIGTKRVNNAVRQIQLLGNLCGPNYDCEPEDVTLIRDTVLRELDLALSRFSPRKRAETSAFKFGSPPKGMNTQH